MNVWAGESWWSQQTCREGLEVLWRLCPKRRLAQLARMQGDWSCTGKGEEGFMFIGSGKRGGKASPLPLTSSWLGAAEMKDAIWDVRVLYGPAAGLVTTAPPTSVWGLAGGFQSPAERRLPSSGAAILPCCWLPSNTTLPCPGCQQSHAVTAGHVSYLCHSLVGILPSGYPGLSQRWAIRRGREGGSPPPLAFRAAYLPWLGWGTEA